MWQQKCLKVTWIKSSIHKCVNTSLYTVHTIDAMLLPEKPSLSTVGLGPGGSPRARTISSRSNGWFQRPPLWGSTIWLESVPSEMNLLEGKKSNCWDAWSDDRLNRRSVLCLLILWQLSGLFEWEIELPCQVSWWVVHSDPSSIALTNSIEHFWPKLFELKSIWQPGGQAVGVAAAARNRHSSQSRRHLCAARHGGGLLVVRVPYWRARMGKWEDL